MPTDICDMVCEYCVGVVNARLLLPSLYQMTPLHVAVKSGNVDVVKLLIGKNADLSITNEYGVSE